MKDESAETCHHLEFKLAKKWDEKNNYQCLLWELITPRLSYSSFFLHFKNIIELDRDEEKDENEVKRAAMKIFKTQKLVTFFLTCLLPTSKLKLIDLLQKNASCWAFLCLFISFMPWNSFIRSDFLFETIIVLGILNVTQYRFIYMLVIRLLESRGYDFRVS